MAATNFKPEFTVCKTESDAFTGMIENRELVRKNIARRSPRGDAAGQCRLLRTVCTHRHEIPSAGRRLANPGRFYQRYAGENSRHERLHCDYPAAYKRIMGMPGRYERGEYK